MGQAEAPGATGEQGNKVPVLFPENARAQEAFEDIAAALIADPNRYKKPVPAALKSALRRIIEYLDFDSIFRGDDFFPKFSDGKAMTWLFSEEHSHLSDLGYEKRHSKLGRLGGVIAMHGQSPHIHLSAILPKRQSFPRWRSNNSSQEGHKKRQPFIAAVFYLYAPLRCSITST